MFKLIKSSSIGINSLVQINCQAKSAINKTIIRGKRQSFSRRPVKILTDSGKDYFQQTDYREPISSAELEFRPNGLNRNESKEFNKYFDEGFTDDMVGEQSIDGHSSGLSGKTSEPRAKEKDRRTDRADQKATKRQTMDGKRSVEKVLKPKLNEIPAYERLGDNNKEFVNLMANLRMRKRREKSNEMLLEGRRLIMDAISANVVLKTIYFSKEENLLQMEDLPELVDRGLKLKKVLYRDFNLFSQLTTSPGVLAVAERPTNQKIVSNDSYVSQKLPLILIADNIRDPGNMGTMVRCAAAVGAEKLVVLKGCVDVWDSKVLRSGAGAHFRVPIVYDIEWPLLFNHIPTDKPFDLFIAESNKDFDESSVIRGRQLDPPAADAEKDIPFHTINQMTRDIDPKTKESVLRDDSYDVSNPELIKYRNSSITSTIYSETKFYTSGTDRPTVLVIGGETHGLSDQSYKLAYDYIGRKIRIPLAFGVESLNSAIAAAVVMYEMKRQFQSQCHSDSTQGVEHSV